jgi:hypothetical protein
MAAFSPPPERRALRVKAHPFRVARVPGAEFFVIPVAPPLPQDFKYFRRFFYTNHLLEQFYKTLTGAERKIGGKKVAFSGGIKPEKNTDVKPFFANAGSQEGGFELLLEAQNTEPRF